MARQGRNRRRDARPAPDRSPRPRVWWRRPRVAVIVVTLVVAGCAVWWWRSSASSRPPDILLISVDTLRADHLGCYGYGLRTPNIDRLASEGVVFEAATAPVPLGIVLLVVLVAGWMFAPALVMPFFNIFFQRQFDLPVAQIGIIFAAAHGVTAFAIFGSGELASRLGPRRALAGWMLLFGPTLLLMTAAGSLGPVIVLYLVQGFVSPATNPLIDQILLELAPSERQGAVSSWRNAATDGSGAGGAAVGGMVLDGASFGALFVLAGIVALVAAPLLIYGLMRRRVAQPVSA